MTQNRRRFERLPGSFQVTCRRSGTIAEAWRPVATLNISAGGILFESEEPCEVADVLEIQIHLMSFKAPLVVKGQVVRVSPLPSGLMQCGAEFMDVTPDRQVEIDEIVQFLKQKRV